MIETAYNHRKFMIQLQNNPNNTNPGILFVLAKSWEFGHVISHSIQNDLLGVL